MSHDGLGEAEELEETVLMLSSLLLGFERALILIGLEPWATAVCSCRMEGFEAMLNGH